MKQKTIKTDKATVLVVELPEGVKEVSCGLHCIGVKPEPTEHLGFDSNGWYHVYRKMFHGWKLLGRMPDIKEEMAAKVVDEYTYNTGEKYGYYDYENDIQTDCPIEFLNSLMYTNEVYFDNPIPPFKERLEDWQEAQSKVFDKERTFLFIKVE